MAQHVERAERLAKEAAAAPPVIVNNCGRQGDILFRRVGAAKAADRATSAGGVIVGAGVHGEHRLIAPKYSGGDGRAHLPEGGVLVHTDVPSARHASFRLAAGEWEFLPQQELRGDQVVKVRD